MIISLILFLIEIILINSNELKNLKKESIELDPGLVESMFKNASLYFEFDQFDSNSIKILKPRSFKKYTYPFSSKITKKSFKMHKRAKLQLEVLKNLSKRFGTTNLTGTIPQQFCPRENIICDQSNFRSFDGSCNNLEHSWYGMTNTPYKRMLPPEYDDGLNSPRTRSVKSSLLPNPRTIATKVHIPFLTRSSISNLFLFFGQTIDHDVTSIGSGVDLNGFPKFCICASQDPECFNIRIPSDDFLNQDQECFVFPRSSASTVNFDCELGHREQINTITHHADLSFLYGSDFSTSQELRAFNDGQLLAVQIPGVERDYLPFQSNPFCIGLSKFERCFKTGESRAESNVLLTALQMVFLRQHNRIALNLSELNRKCNDERLFQETRKIMIGMYQHIIYNEWLPTLLGPDLYKKFDLAPQSEGFFMGYDNKVSPSLYNELASAALRFGHALIKLQMNKAHGNFSLFEPRTTDNFLFGSTDFFKDGLKTPEDFLRGMIAEDCYAPRSQVNDVLNNKMFQGFSGRETKRFSLPALNIQRGRDHGIPPYNKYRKLCGLKVANNFEDLDNIPTEIIDRLKTVYENVNDIDLWTGAISEVQVKDGVVGETFGCMLAIQFKDFKLGDRFYYENGHDPKTGFTLPQLNEIRKTTIEKMLCNTVSIVGIQQNAFMVSSRSRNPFIRCRDLPDINLSEWNLQC